MLVHWPPPFLVSIPWPDQLHGCYCAIPSAVRRFERGAVLFVTHVPYLMSHDASILIIFWRDRLPFIHRQRTRFGAQLRYGYFAVTHRISRFCSFLTVDSAADLRYTSTCTAHALCTAHGSTGFATAPSSCLLRVLWPSRHLYSLFPVRLAQIKGQ